jgi:CarboxypepD_reg-like domain
MKESKNLFLLLFSFLFSISIYSQSGKIQGKVIDFETGKPLIGANIWLKGTKIGAATNPEGKYIISNISPGSYNIVANYMGFHSNETENVKIIPASNKNLDFALNPDYNFKIDPNLEKFYLDKLDPETRNSLEEIKSYSEDVYSRLLQKIYFDKLASVPNSGRDDQIEILNIRSNLYALKYKNATSGSVKGEIKSKLRKTLDNLFTLIQSKREQDIKNLTIKLNELNESLNSLKYKKQEVINQKMRELLND